MNTGLLEHSLSTPALAASTIYRRTWTHRDCTSSIAVIMGSQGFTLAHSTHAGTCPPILTLTHHTTPEHLAARLAGVLESPRLAADVYYGLTPSR